MFNITDCLDLSTWNATVAADTDKANTDKIKIELLISGTDTNCQNASHTVKNIIHSYENLFWLEVFY